MSMRIAPAVRNVCARRPTGIVHARGQVLRRRFATGSDVPPPNPPKSSSSPLLLGGLALAVAGGAFYYFGTGGTPVDAAKELGTVAKGAALVVERKAGLTHSKEDYQKVYDAIAEELELEGYDDGSLAPVLIRLAWHCSGTYDKDDKTGGSNYATMRFKPESAHGANNGLNIAREHMQKIKEKFPWISYGDLWTLGGVVAVQESGGPSIPWRAGRVDGFEHHVTPDGRLPDAAQAEDHLRHIFYRMGFGDKEIVALSGAHAMGRCHTGPWSFSPTTFSNAYFDLLLNSPWQWRKWKGPAQYEDKKTKTLMMLPTDMALVKDKSFRKYAEKYAKDEAEFFKDFSDAFAKLLELGVPTAQLPAEPWKLGSQ